MIRLDCLPNAIPDEHVVYFLRRHPITQLWLLLSYVVVLIAPFASSLYVSRVQPIWWESEPVRAITIMAGSAFFLFAWLFLFQAFIDYYLDMWIVTTRRVLNIEQAGLFGRTISELRLYRIQDVTSSVQGIIRTVFNFGTVEVQTAGEHVRCVFEDVSNPSNVAKGVLELSEVDRRQQLDHAVEEFGMPASGESQKDHETHRKNPGIS